MIKSLYKNIIFKYSKIILISVLISVISLGFFSYKVHIDASSQTLVLQDDEDLLFSRKVGEKFYSNDILLIAYKPNEYLLDDTTINTIKNLTTELEKLDFIDSIVSINNVPLLQSPTIKITDLVNEVRTLSKSNPDKNLVREEFLNSPLYKNALVSSDFKTTSIVLNLKRDQKFYDLIKERNTLLFQNNLSKIQKIELEKKELELKQYTSLLRDKEKHNIKNVRDIIAKYENTGELFLGGVSMIANDVIGFVRNDLFVYGISLLVLIIFILWVIFKQLIWIILPLSICFLSVIATTGFLGIFGWDITVISSNFIALQLIITISIVVHLIVRYQELSLKYKHASNYKIILNTVLSKFNPSFFAIVTTVAGFSSLVLSNIVPVVNLGLMMSCGIIISLFISFVVFPAVLINMKRIDIEKEEKKYFSLTDAAINVVINKKKIILTITIISMIFSLYGTLKLRVENSFINYFKSSTDIYKGMEVIDKDLGGTTPLDIIVTFKQLEQKNKEVENNDFLSSFEDEFQDDANDDKYWFTKQKMDLIKKVHSYLENINYIGNVQSFATILNIGKVLNNNEDLDGFKLALLYNEIPKDYQKLIITPYINIKENMVRFSTRIIDSNPELKRAELIQKINQDLKEIIPSNIATYRLSNLMIMYNNMLQSLFTSQIKTIGFVFLILLFMFLILFRNIKIAFIALIVNIIPIGIIFGIMGTFNIPLDIMTITIAAISFGIGVDDTIHYIHRFKEEFKKDHNYTNSMKRAHKSIGYAMYYTSLIIVIGFSILMLSNLIPTIYFGFLTVVVMIAVLISDLVLLPYLLLIIKPFKLNHCSKK